MYMECSGEEAAGWLHFLLRSRGLGKIKRNHIYDISSIEFLKTPQRWVKVLSPTDS